MGDWDVGRVEPKMLLAGSGMSADTEQLARLADLQKQTEKQLRPPPQKPFAKVLAESASEPTLSAKEERRRALPKKALRPSVWHPARRRSFAGEDEEDANAPLVLKG